ncbi:hypothetical protein [Vibrio sp. qd031]|nr:hypothetical protein [Vibrio sp. qd031]
MFERHPDYGPTDDGRCDATDVVGHQQSKEIALSTIILCLGWLY